MSKILSLWNRFFFEPISASTLGVFRIVFGLVVFESLIGKIQDRAIFYGQNSIVSRATAETFFPGWSSKFSLIYLVPGSDSLLLLFFAVMIVLSCCLIAGLVTRASTILLFLGFLALSNRDFFADNVGDDLIRLNCFYLMFAQAGAAFSLDSWLFQKKSQSGDEPVLVSAWPVRLLQLQLAYVYLDMVYLKLHGQDWRDGTALYYALNYLEFKRFDFHIFFNYLWQTKMATWLMLAIETAAGTLVWWKKTRYWVLLAVLFLHLGINLVMQLPVFQSVMIASLIVFIEPQDLEKFLVTKPWRSWPSQLQARLRSLKFSKT